MKCTTSAVFMTACHCLVQMVFIVCITIAAIKFNNLYLLWWYILPACMTVTFRYTKNDTGETTYET